MGGVMDPVDPFASERLVIFARELFDRTIGLDFPGRVFLAGGAFKTLIHGRPPRDLDLWAPTPDDRSLLIGRLGNRGAAPLARRAYSDAFVLGGYELEVPDRVGPESLDDLLSRFDLGLSAVGVELCHGRLEGRVLLEAGASVEQRAVLILKPPPNPKHILGTIARARRYSEELGWCLSAEDEALAWSIFEGASEDERENMLKRYQYTALRGWGVYEEAMVRRTRSGKDRGTAHPG